MNDRAKLLELRDVEDHQVKIVVRGAWATLRAGPLRVLDKACRFLDPKAEDSAAFREERWDGMVSLNSGFRFPAGLVKRVRRFMRRKGVKCHVIGRQDRRVDTSRFTPGYVPGITLYPHQFEACMACFENPRGIVHAATQSGKTLVQLCVALFLWEEFGYRTLIVVPKKGLCVQTVREFKRWFGDSVTIGQMGDGRKTVGPIVVGTAQTLIGFAERTRKVSRKKKGTVFASKTIAPNEAIRDVVENYEVLMLDETHHGSADTWFKIAMASKAKRRYGFSGTPLRREGLYDARIIGATGPVIYHAPATAVIARGLASKPKIAVVMSKGASAPDPGFVPGMDAKTAYRYVYDKCIVHSKRHNAAVIRAVRWLVAHGRKTLLLCRRKPHFIRLSKLLEKSGMEFEAIWGATQTQRRERAKKAFADGVVNVLLASTILDEGESVPAIGGMVLAEGVKSHISAVQRVGRGMAIEKGGPSDVWIVDFLPLVRMLDNHGISRVDSWEHEGYEVRVVEAWPAVGKPGFDENDLLPFERWDELEAEGVAA